ncbi:hypothetical protein PPL_04914 [Heterostelium album PN500]|uniref:EGF-like domain-containing protein n=1 Tax=Heterostelium pallidum (strain ATCC 26659 / Pp 5 / PN500) TaxID=670386 RepID=D3B8X1_HETP5|nr:hypothetical protein PPL_04914 [Heterostelium album PN500]EFA82489.1 hypothetical protein PPL_04914 [Heterostelium album PN500]|eukprot:XP_020434606.1 hypothetical protein PPL_04914 [Heterostelium album PN500]
MNSYKYLFQLLLILLLFCFGTIHSVNTRDVSVLSEFNPLFVDGNSECAFDVYISVNDTTQVKLITLSSGSGNVINITSTRIPFMTLENQMFLLNVLANPGAVNLTIEMDDGNNYFLGTTTCSEQTARITVKDTKFIRANDGSYYGVIFIEKDNVLASSNTLQQNILYLLDGYARPLANQTGTITVLNRDATQLGFKFAISQPYASLNSDFYITLSIFGDVKSKFIVRNPFDIGNYTVNSRISFVFMNGSTNFPIQNAIINENPTTIQDTFPQFAQIETFNQSKGFLSTGVMPVRDWDNQTTYLSPLSSDLYYMQAVSIELNIYSLTINRAVDVFPNFNVTAGSYPNAGCYIYSVPPLVVNLATTLSAVLPAPKKINIRYFDGIANIRVQFISVYPIRSIRFSYLEMTQSNLVSGSTTAGVLEANIEGNNMLLMKNEYMIVSDQSNYQMGLSNLFYTNITTNTSFQIEDITYFEFGVNNMELKSGIDVKNTLFLKVRSPIPYFTPSLSFPNTGKSFSGVFVPELQLYYINFDVISSQIAGNMTYTLSNGIDTFSNSYLELVGIKNATLTITKSNITAIPALKVLVPSDSNRTIGWSVAIRDQPNGFEYGLARVISSANTVPIEIYFNGATRTYGNANDGLYNIYLNISGNCATQTYRLMNLYLFDKSNVIQFDALLSMIGRRDDQLSITANCQDPIDIDPPELVSLVANEFVDVGSNQRTLVFTLFGADSGSGMSKSVTPVIKLIPQYPYEVLTIPTVVNGSNAKGVTYRATIDLPYGYGCGDSFIFSVYGLVDNHMNFISYTSIDLEKNGKPYFVKRYFNITTPVLQSTSTVTRNQNSFYVHGKGFGLNVMPPAITAYINYGNGYQITSFEYISQTLLKFNIQPSIGPLKIFVTVNSKSSNELVVLVSNPSPWVGLIPIPTVTPTSSPSPSCPGNCNNRGQCTFDGCRCNLPYYGPSCSSEAINVTPPAPQTTPVTSNNITINDNVDFETSMKVTTIKELDAELKEIKTYTPTNWKLDDQSTDNQTVYLYYSKLEGRDTFVNVTIEYFKVQTNITFGDKQIVLSPSSIKFTVALSSFSFTDKLSSLQVEMDISIGSNSDDACISNSVGLDNSDNVQWLKMNIDKQSLYSRFVPYALIDDRPLLIRQRLLEQSNETKSTTNKVGIIIPFYFNQVLIDPDFSHLVDIDDSPSACEGKDDSKITTKIIIGVVVGVVGLAILISLSVFIIKKIGKHNLKIKIIKLKRLGQDTTK